MWILNDKYKRLEWGGNSLVILDNSQVCYQRLFDNVVEGPRKILLFGELIYDFFLNGNREGEILCYPKQKYLSHIYKQIGI